MVVLETTILLIVIVILSNIISHYFVSIPTALIEIAIGVFAALLLNLKIELDADWFMLLFIAPLLFSDAKHFPKKELWELKAPIFANAIWLVLLTTLLGGFLINFFIPEVSLTLSFALAAVLSPTDPVAVQGIAEQVKLPKRILILISGESLINDASGIIAFKYALAAFLTSTFSIRVATIDFLYMSICGAVIGFVLIKIIYLIERVLLRQGIKDVILHVSTQILTPFIIFIVAEIVNASGVIAVVVAGVVSIQQEPLYKRQYSEIKLVATKVWDIIIYQLNGIVFVILGASLPFAMSAAIIDPRINNFILVTYVLIIWFILLIIRTFWSYAYMWMTYHRSKNNDRTKPKFYTALLTGLTGVRGAITMAMVLSIPFFMPNGDLLSERYLVIFLASGVILTSLLVAVITLPILTKKKTRLVLSGDEAFMEHEEENEQNEENDYNEKKHLSEIETKKLMTKAAIQALQNDITSENKMVISDILADLDKQLKILYLNDNTTSNEDYHNIELYYRNIASQVELDTAKELIKHEDLPKQLSNQYLQMLIYKRKAHNSNSAILLKQTLFKTRKRLKLLVLNKLLHKNYIPKDTFPIFNFIENESAKQAIMSLRKCRKDISVTDIHRTLKMAIIDQLILEYQSKIDRIKNYELRQEKEYQIVYQEYFLKMLDEERSVIQSLLEKGKISNELANQLRQSINYSETTFLQGSLD